MRPLIDSNSAQRLVSAFTLSRVNYYNAVLAALHVSTRTRAQPQRVLNAAARFVAGTAARTNVNSVIKSLHWLPIASRIRFKLSLLMHGVNNGTSQAYPSDITSPISSMPGDRRLCSATTNEVDVTRTRTEFGDRAFYVAGPCEWNNLPADVRNSTDLSTFKRAIKMHSFRLTCEE